METINNEVAQSKKEFVAPKSISDFPTGETKIEHTYENGNKVVFILLSTGMVARIREGSGKDVEKATLESGGNKEKYLTALTASCVSIDEKNINMFELAENKMKDYLAIQSTFAEVNF